MDEIKKSAFKKMIAIGIIVVIVLLIPTSVTVPYEKLENYQESYTTQEAYEVQVPYNDIEYYTEKEPFPDIKYTTKNLVYNAAYKTCVGRVPLISDAKVTVTVNNLDNAGGTFKLWVGLILPDGNRIGQEVSNYVYPLQSADFTYTANSAVSSCTYDVLSIPTKTISESFTNYRDVQKSRTVTKYRTETNYRDVVKTRPAQRYVTAYTQKTVMMFQRILGWY